MPSSGEGKPHARQGKVQRRATQKTSACRGAKTRGCASGFSHEAQAVACTGATTPHDAQIGVRGSTAAPEAIGAHGNTALSYDARVRLFSSDGDPAVIGVGQEANAIFAFGQLARGFIAVGQVAVGVVAVGQLCFAVVGLGQAGAGVTWFAGMLGVGGRGFCLRLIPGIDPPRVAPPTTTFESFLDGSPGAEAFVRADIVETPRGGALALGGRALPVKLTPAVAWALGNAFRKHRVRSIFAHIKRTASGPVCDRLVEVPGTRATYPLALQIARVVLLCAVAAGWWYAFAWIPWGR
jgi:hypothetical protein